MKKAIIVSGYFNPVHKGHIEYFNHAKALGDELIVIVNNDHQRKLKGSKEFQDEKERVYICFQYQMCRPSISFNRRRPHSLRYHSTHTPTFEERIPLGFCEWGGSKL